MQQLLQYAAMTVSLVGVVLNVRKCRWCFALWFASNLAWAVWGAWTGAWGLTAQNLVFAGFSIWGWRVWSREAARAGQRTLCE